MKGKAREVTAEQSVLKLLQRDLAPDWLRQSWNNAEASGLDVVSMDEIEAEIAAVRKARRTPDPQSTS